jgi:SEC-C motif-containing protein
MPRFVAASRSKSEPGQALRAFDSKPPRHASILRRMEVPWADSEALEAHCLPFIRQQKKPATAVELMGSRYVAYATGAVDYLFETHDPKTRSHADRQAIESWASRADFTGLEILNTEAGGPNDETGGVEFIASYSIDGTPHQHHEKATFRRIDGAWFFVDGQVVVKQPIRRESPKISRNEPCSCGSGKKYKRCHGAVGAGAR